MFLFIYIFILFYFFYRFVLRICHFCRNFQKFSHEMLAFPHPRVSFLTNNIFTAIFEGKKNNWNLIIRNKIYQKTNIFSPIHNFQRINQAKCVKNIFRSPWILTKYKKGNL